MNDIVYQNYLVIIENVSNFDLKQTFDCGQAFRWNEDADGVWQGSVLDKSIKLYCESDKIIIEGATKEDFENFWFDYFDLSRDYSKVIDTISSDPILKKATAFGNGIRILKQDPWEALCSFIISQNNNIPRIKGIVERMCENFGEETAHGYTFPTARKIASHSLEDLAVLRSGFRAKYILDAAKRVASGEVDLTKIPSLPTDEARAELTKIYGVGEKVADCALLYGMGHINAFPKDVWIKRAVPVFFGNDFDETKIENAGIIQQYIFFYARETKLEI